MNNHWFSMIRTNSNSDQIQCMETLSGTGWYVSKCGDGTPLPVAQTDRGTNIEDFQRQNRDAPASDVRRGQSVQPSIR